jgi:hypothetical protein
MKRQIWLGLMTAVTLLGITEEGARAVAAVQARIGAIRIDGAFQQGQVAGREAEARKVLAEVTAAVQECEGMLRVLIRDRREPEVLAARRKLEELNAYGLGIQKALQSGGQAPQQMTQLVYAMAQQYMDGIGMGKTEGFRQLARDPEAKVSQPNAAALQESLTLLAAVDQDCQGKYKPIAGAAHPNFNREQDPALWCGMAARRAELARKLAL